MEPQRCQVEVDLESVGGPKLCGALLELAEQHENVTSFHVAYFQKLPDGRQRVVASIFTEQVAQTSQTKRWIRCRLGHHVMDLNSDVEIKWN